jgi:hypothetical protein
MSTNTTPASGRGEAACLSMAERRDEDDAIIDHLLFDDEEWSEDFDGPDQTSLEEAGIIIEQDQENG